MTLKSNETENGAEKEKVYSTEKMEKEMKTNKTKE